VPLLLLDAMPDLIAAPSINRVLPASLHALAWPLFDTASTRQIEHDAASSLPPHTLMHRAGEAVARLALAIAPHARHIWIAAGPGNNGGDGFEAARHLHAAGKLVSVSFVGEARALPIDAAQAYQRALDAGVTISSSLQPPRLDANDLAIDALLGLGTTRAPHGAMAMLIDELNRTAAQVLAVDLPTGLNADTGQRCTAVVADHTLSLLTLKPGLFTAHGRDHAGCIWWCNLGVEPACAAATARLIASEASPTRLHAQHKGSFGSVAIVGGAQGMSGAALLAGRAALHAGAGRIYVNMLDAAALPLDAQAPELMLRTTIDWQAPSAEGLTVVAGCGGGDAIRAALPQLLSRAMRLVIDVDGLNALASDPALQMLLSQRARRSQSTILTPHPLEAARCLGTSINAVQTDRLGAARELAQRHACIVVLKGSGTIVQPPDGLPWINPTGNASLGTAGTGDVLAGWIGGLWTQGPTALHAACQAVYRHGQCAEQWSSTHPDATLSAGALIPTI